MLQLRSTVTSAANLELSLVDVPIPEPEPEEVVIRIDAAPINPSDLGLLLGGADIETAKVSGSGADTVLSASIPKARMRALAARVDQSLPVGNEGAGSVVSAGSSDAAQALLGKTVALPGGAMYAQYRCFPARACLVLPEGTTAAEGASCFVNPLTALGMVETMKLEGHTALVHTAAASNLGQMLNKLCIADGVSLVNIVRKPEQQEILEKLGAKIICNSTSPSFMNDLTDAIAETGATLAFDATGGGDLASRILACMESAASRNATEFNRYGSATHKQVYVYGGLDPSPTVLTRSFGMAWSVGGWLLLPFLQQIGFETAQKLRERVAAEIKTTFASHYSREVTLVEMLQLDAVSVYAKQATGEKFLITPNG